MNDNIIIDNNVIERLLYLLDKLQKNKMDIDNFLEEYQSSDKYSQIEKQEIQTAYYIKKFADEMPGGFFIYRADDEAGEIIYTNKAMLRLFNCNNVQEFYDLTGNTFKGIVHPDDFEAADKSIKKQISDDQNGMDYVEYRIIQKGGEVRWVDDYGHFVHTDVAGDVFYVFLADTTEKKNIVFKEKENLLKEKRKKEEQFKKLIEEYDEELKVINQEQLRRLEMIEGLSVDYESIFYANLDSNKIKAYRVSERFAKDFPEDSQVREFTGFDTNYINEWVYPEDRELLYGITDIDFIRKKLAANKTFHINYRVLFNNKTKYIQLRIVNIGSKDCISQIVIGYRNIDDEIIQEMKQKQILSEALNEVTLANKAKDLFLSNMSHDIRTPMNAIMGFTSLAKKHINDKEKINNYLDMISTSSNQLFQLLNNTLEISRIESGKNYVEENECNLIDIVQHIQVAMLPQVEIKNITLSLDISKLKHDNVYADQKKLDLILSNLVDNAVKYTNNNDWVTIMVIENEESQDEHTTYQFIVEDNGIGIGEDFMDHIFEPFEREKNTTLSGIYGTGLGLKITKDLVKMMGGTIDVISTVGKGSRFCVNLPLKIVKQSSADSAIDDVSMNFSDKKRILIVDDNEINLEIENEVLTEAGFLVDTAADGSIALEKVKKSKPGDYDLILMDIQMPIMNGYHATRAIRKLENPLLSSIPIIAVSANTFEEDKKTAIESGMNAHLAKPLDTPLLYKLIWKYLKEDK